MKLDSLLGEWVKCVQMSMPKVASFCGLPDPVALRDALEANDFVIILAYRNFGISGRKEKWRTNRTCYMDQYWRRVSVKVGDVDKKRIQVFCLPIANILQAPALLESLVNRRFKIQPASVHSDLEGGQSMEYEVQFWSPPVELEKGSVFDSKLYELSKTDDETQLDTLKTMTDNYLRNR